MKNLYYAIWADVIRRMLSVPSNKSDWKFYSQLIVSFIMGIDYAFLLLLMSEIFGFKISSITAKINIFPGDRIDGFLEFFISFMLPFVIINWWLIFRKDRYEIIIKEYRFLENKLAFLYLILGIGLPILIFAVAFFYAKLVK